jgi:hypothetical protein
MAYGITNALIPLIVGGFVRSVNVKKRDKIRCFRFVSFLKLEVSLL